MSEKDIKIETFGTIETTTKSTVSSTYNIYLNDCVVGLDKYHKFMHILRTAGEDDIINLVLQNYGGSCHTCLAVGNLMLACKAVINVEVVAPCYSAGTTLALSGDSLVMHKHSFLMFHDYSGGFEGKGSEIKSHVEATDKFIRGYMMDFHLPFLTKKEHLSIVAGKDLYIHANDKGVRQRIKRHFG